MKEGDVVKLKSGGFPMTLVELGCSEPPSMDFGPKLIGANKTRTPDMGVVVWFSEEGEMRTGTLPLHAFVLEKDYGNS